MQEKRKSSFFKHNAHICVVDMTFTTTVKESEQPILFANNGKRKTAYIKLFNSFIRKLQCILGHVTWETTVGGSCAGSPTRMKVGHRWSKGIRVSVSLACPAYENMHKRTIEINRMKFVPRYQNVFSIVGKAHNNNNNSNNNKNNNLFIFQSTSST